MTPCSSRRSALLLTIVLAIVCPAVASAQTFKIATWNVRSGRGQHALDPAARRFNSDSLECPPHKTDPNGLGPNAWGVGFFQAQLTASVAAEPAIVALVVQEAWTCATPRNLLATLPGWRTAAAGPGGLGIVAKYGFRNNAVPVFRRLNASRDTHVVSANVCLDSGCTSSIEVYGTHWHSPPADGPDTVGVMAAARTANRPHLLVGDLNAWEYRACRQEPEPGGLSDLRSAGYVDIWAHLHPTDPGYTGMLNRTGCGTPLGAPWKRIDYSWARGITPLSVERFGVPEPIGDAASDHTGLIVEYLIPPFVPPDAGEPPPPTFWTNVANALATGTTIQKTQGCVSCFDAGGYSAGSIAAGDGSVQFTPPVDRRLVAGLGADRTGSMDPARINHAFGFWAGGKWDIRESGVYRREGTYAAGDVFTVAIERGVVKYYRNATVVYTSTVAPVYPAGLRVAILTMSATVSNAKISGSSEPPPPPSTSFWTNLVNAVGTGTTLEKTEGCLSCFDAGGSSVAAIASGDGSVQFTPSVDSRLAAGLGGDRTSNVSPSRINYSFGLWPGGTWDIRENGVYRKEGTYVAGDVFTVAIEAGIVNYYRNATLVYRSAVAPVYPLGLDVSLLTIGGSISDARVQVP